MEIITTNKKANFEYFIEKTYQAGICLVGDEVKSIRQKHISLVDSFVFVRNGEVFLKNAYIKCYQNAFLPIDEKRSRKLLLNKQEIEKLSKLDAGRTIIPTKVYFKGSYCKVEIAVCKGKKLY
ncbi:MAG: SsrA-binding protein SmpB, partial [Clostridia bacterium]|nr:SsrA-binding protein SmpB [Clostridia bacterium]